MVAARGEWLRYEALGALAVPGEGLWQTEVVLRAFSFCVGCYLLCAGQCPRCAVRCPSCVGFVRVLLYV